jgi:tetratricopeptide (TPR) repeat protein
MDQSLASQINNSFNITRIILNKALNEEYVNDGDCLEIVIKPLFKKSILSLQKMDLDSLLGYKLTESIYTDLYSYHIKFGYFKTIVDQILQKAIFGMNLYDRVQVSFEVDSNLIDSSFLQSKCSSVNKSIFLDFKFDIYLKSIEKKARLVSTYELEEQELFEISLDHKKDANCLYSKNLIISAFMRYKRSISFLIIAENQINYRLVDFDRKSGSIDDEEEKNIRLKKEILELKSQIFSNMAMCQLKSKNYKNVIINCTKSLEINKSNVKSFYRRGLAYLNQNEFDDAIRDLNKAIDLDPKSYEIFSALKKAETLKKNHTLDMQSKLKKNFQ